MLNFEEKNDGQGVHPECLRYYNGFGQYEFTEFVKGTLTISDNLIKDWEILDQSDIKSIHSVLAQESFKVIIGFLDRIFFDIYYKYLPTLTESMIEFLEDTNNKIRIYVFIGIFINLILLILSIFLLIKPIHNLLKKFLCILHLYPIMWLTINVELKHQIKKYFEYFNI